MLDPAKGNVGEWVNKLYIENTLVHKSNNFEYKYAVGDDQELCIWDNFKRNRLSPPLAKAEA